MEFIFWCNIFVVVGVVVVFFVVVYNDYYCYVFIDGVEGCDVVGFVIEVYWDEKRGRRSNFVLNVEFEIEDG